jgi:hypothetical protein
MMHVGVCRCPHCQRFKPQYEHVAALFNTEPRTSPDVVVGAVDCVDQVCDSTTLACARLAILPPQNPENENPHRTSKADPRHSKIGS